MIELKMMPFAAEIFDVCHFSFGVSRFRHAEAITNV